MNYINIIDDVIVGNHAYNKRIQKISARKGIKNESNPEEHAEEYHYDNLYELMTYIDDSGENFYFGYD